MLDGAHAADTAADEHDPSEVESGLRIVHYYPRALVGDGGCTASVRGWAAAEARAGVDVVLACDRGPRPMPAGIRLAEVRHRGRAGVRAPAGMSAILGRGDLFVLHSGWVFHNIAAARLARKLDVPYIMTPHGAYNPNVFRRRRIEKALWWRLLERPALLGARGVHVFFDEEAEFITAAGFRGPIIVAPNGVTLPSFQRQDHRERFALWMGRFDVETKGIDVLLRSYARLPAASRIPLRLHGPDWRGGKERVRRLIGDLGLQDIATVGPAAYGADKWRLLRRCALFLFTPRWDSSSVMALEAAGAGAPIVATSSTFIGRQLANAGGAILVPPTVDGLAEGIEQGLTEEASVLGARAAAVVRERFTWAAVVRQFLDQVERLT